MCRYRVFQHGTPNLINLLHTNTFSIDGYNLPHLQNIISFFTNHKKMEFYVENYFISYQNS